MLVAPVVSGATPASRAMLPLCTTPLNRSDGRTTLMPAIPSHSFRVANLEGVYRAPGHRAESRYCRPVLRYNSYQKSHVLASTWTSAAKDRVMARSGFLSLCLAALLTLLVPLSLGAEEAPVEPAPC